VGVFVKRKKNNQLTHGIAAVTVDDVVLFDLRNKDVAFTFETIVKAVREPVAGDDDIHPIHFSDE